MPLSRNYISTSLARSSAVLDGYKACCSIACLSVHGLTGALLTDTSPCVETRWSVARLAVGYHGGHIPGGHITVHDWLRRGADGCTLRRCMHHCLLPLQYAYLVAHRLAWLGGDAAQTATGRPVK